MHNSQDPVNFSFVDEPKGYPSSYSNSPPQGYIYPSEYCASQQLPQEISHRLFSNDPYLFPLDHGANSQYNYPSWRDQIPNQYFLATNPMFAPNLLQANQYLSGGEEQRVARNKRKLARQKSLLNRITSNSSFGSTSSSLTHGVETRRLALNEVGEGSSRNKNLYHICINDKKLRVLLIKELKKSDVGTLGRIVLPKKETEDNLPTLSNKEGIEVMIRDVCSDQIWNMKLKYWTNNKSRMYVLENTGEFVKKHDMEVGDFLTLYEDESKNLYFTIKKAEKEISVSMSSSYPYSTNIIQNYHSRNQTQEEDASLSLLIDQLTHEDHRGEVNIAENLSNANFSCEQGIGLHNSSMLMFGNGNAINNTCYNLKQPTSASMQNLSSMLGNAINNTCYNLQQPTSATSQNLSLTLGNAINNPCYNLQQPTSATMQNLSSTLGEIRATDDRELDNSYGTLDMLPDMNRYYF